MKFTTPSGRTERAGLTAKPKKAEALELPYRRSVVSRDMVSRRQDYDIEVWLRLRRPTVRSSVQHTEAFQVAAPHQHRPNGTGKPYFVTPFNESAGVGRTLNPILGTVSADGRFLCPALRPYWGTSRHHQVTGSVPGSTRLTHSRGDRRIYDGCPVFSASGLTSRSPLAPSRGEHCCCCVARQLLRAVDRFLCASDRIRGRGPFCVCATSRVGGSSVCRGRR